VHQTLLELTSRVGWGGVWRRVSEDLSEVRKQIRQERDFLGGRDYLMKGLGGARVMGIGSPEGDTSSGKFVPTPAPPPTHCCSVN